MISAHIEEKLRMFRKETYEILREKEHTELKEKKQDGKVNLICMAQNELLIFTSPEEHVLPYLDGHLQCACDCRISGTRGASHLFVFRFPS